MRYLSRLTRVGLEAFLECADECAPMLVALANGGRDARVCIGADSPDNHYQNATVSSEHCYRLRGTRGTVHYLGLSTNAGSYGQPGGLATVHYLEAAELELGPAGELDVLVCTRARRPAAHTGPNWLELLEDPAPHQILVRQTFMNRASEAMATLRVERVGAPTLPQDLTPARLIKGLETTGLFVAGASMMFARWAAELRAAENTLPLFDQLRSNKMGGDPNIRYYHSYWRVEGGQHLLVEALPPPGVDTWNYQLNNHWMESLDYRYYQIHVNKGRAVLRPDGSIAIVVARSDPQLPGVNWVDPAGHEFGTCCFRWIRPNIAGDTGYSELLSGCHQPRCEVLPDVTELRKRLGCVLG